MKENYEGSRMSGESESLIEQREKLRVELETAKSALKKLETSFSMTMAEWKESEGLYGEKGDVMGRVGKKVDEMLEPLMEFAQEYLRPGQTSKDIEEAILEKRRQRISEIESSILSIDQQLESTKG